MAEVAKVRTFLSRSTDPCVKNTQIVYHLKLMWHEKGRLNKTMCDLRHGKRFYMYIFLINS